MRQPDPLWISEAEVVSLMDMGDAIRALETGLLAEGRPRGSADDLTVFKALGMGISDLSLGIELYRRAVQSGRGRALTHPQRAEPIAQA